MSGTLSPREIAERLLAIMEDDDFYFEEGVDEKTVSACIGKAIRVRFRNKLKKDWLINKLFFSIVNKHNEDCGCLGDGRRESKRFKKDHMEGGIASFVEQYCK